MYEGEIAKFKYLKYTGNWDFSYAERDHKHEYVELATTDDVPARQNP